MNKFPQNVFNVFHGSIEELEQKIPAKKIDLILCNILAPVIKSIGPGFKKIIGYKGKLILSGLLVDQVKELQEFFFSLGWKVMQVKTKEQWALIVLTQKSF